MAKGALSKEYITNKILEVFDGSFKYDKEIRIPVEENGEVLQIKCVLTAAKVNVSAGSDNAIPTEATSKLNIDTTSLEITPEEKQEVADLVSKLNL